MASAAALVAAEASVEVVAASAALVVCSKILLERTTGTDTVQGGFSGRGRGGYGGGYGQGGYESQGGYNGGGGYQQGGGKMVLIILISATRILNSTYRLWRLQRLAWHYYWRLPG